MTSHDAAPPAAPVELDDADDADGGSELDVMETSGPGADSIVCTVRVSPDATSVARVRHQIVADLQDRDMPESLVDEAEIVASELLTNAVRHARPLSDGTIRVRWKIRGEVVEVEVTDGGGATVPHPAPRTVWLSSGRGLRIVRSIAHEWGVTEDRAGSVVWATLGGPSRRRAT